eukprot:1147798-Pelagomonas_calceolata.AAC.6
MLPLAYLYIHMYVPTHTVCHWPWPGLQRCMKKPPLTYHYFMLHSIISNHSRSSSDSCKRRATAVARLKMLPPACLVSP